MRIFKIKGTAGCQKVICTLNAYFLIVTLVRTSLVLVVMMADIIMRTALTAIVCGSVQSYVIQMILAKVQIDCHPCCCEKQERRHHNMTGNSDHIFDYTVQNNITATENVLHNFRYDLYLFVVRSCQLACVSHP
jgi:hypothetical protein